MQLQLSNEFPINLHQFFYSEPVILWSNLQLNFCTLSMSFSEVLSHYSSGEDELFVLDEFNL